MTQKQKRKHGETYREWFVRLLGVRDSELLDECIKAVWFDAIEFERHHVAKLLTIKMKSKDNGRDRQKSQ